MSKKKSKGNETVTRAYLADKIHDKFGYPRTQSAEIIDAVIEEMISGMEEDNEVKISSFGTFKVKEKKERVGRNPKTKKEVPVTARRVASFYVSNLLKKRINEGS